MKNGLETDDYGNKFWYKNDLLHREDGPAVEYADGTKAWCKEGKQHREDGPAIECDNGNKVWYKEGKFHREDGPAIEFYTKYYKIKEWYFNGKWIDCKNQEEFEKLIKLKSFW